MTMYLYRKTMQAVTLTMALAALSFSGEAQFRVAPPERKTPRAVAVLETFKNGSRRLIPVTFLYEKKYYDATFYHATPVPFTLYSETVYEVQQFGQPQGTFTVQSATRSAAEWFGNGKFKGLPDPSLMAKKKKAAPVVVEDPSKPVLHRREGSEGDSPAAHPSSATSKSGAEAEEDPDRPKLHRRENSGGDAAATPASASSGSVPSGSAPAQTQGQASAQAGASAQSKADPTEESSGQDPDRPKLHRRDEESGSGTPAKGTASTQTAPTTTASGSTTATASTTATPTTSAKPAAGAVVVLGQPELTPSDDPDHPILRRGKPVQEQGGRDLPDFKKEEPVSRQVAVSDAGASVETPTLIYVCREEERTQLESEARELARAELRRLSAWRGLTLPAAKPAATEVVSSAKGKAGTRAKPPAAAPELKLTEEQFIPYDLDYNNYATVVYSARYTPEGAADAAAAGGKPKSWLVTVIAREDEGYKLVKLYSAVSDPKELDLYPEVRLVDAVDPEGYGHYGILLREQKREGVSWLLGRATGYELQTVFETAAR
jgi:hypothetical protein